jgi:hypothetical protein
MELQREATLRSETIVKHADWQIVGMHSRTKALLFRGLFVLWGVMMLAFSFGTMWQRARLDFDGIIEHRDEKRHWSGPHRSYTVYIIRPATGGNSFQYVAEGNDAALSSELPIGAHIVKRKWQLSYSVNGQPRHDFPRVFYRVVAGIGLVIFLVAVPFLYRKWRTASTIGTPSVKD